jgi:hypothetical protein
VAHRSPPERSCRTVALSDQCGARTPRDQSRQPPYTFDANFALNATRLPKMLQGGSRLASIVPAAAVPRRSSCPVGSTIRPRTYSVRFGRSSRRGTTERQSADQIPSSATIESTSADESHEISSIDHAAVELKRHAFRLCVPASLNPLKTPRIARTPFFPQRPLHSGYKSRVPPCPRDCEAALGAFPVESSARSRRGRLYVNPNRDR